MFLPGTLFFSLFITAFADLPSLLAKLKGATSVDCKAVCEAVAKPYQGMGMSRAGDVATYNCNCGGEKTVVACTGNPFLQCCKDKCAGTECPSTAAGWHCPADGGCDGGHCAGPDWQEWVAAHNIYRCMHDVPPLSWNNLVFQDAAQHFETVTTMIHSKCYDVKPPAGPAGENLFQGTGQYSPLDAVKAWYSEIKDCGALPGCKTGAKGTIGHFTAMIWNGDKTIGCFHNKFNLWGCRYKALDFASCNTPNYGGDTSYPHNVFPKVKTFEVCLAAVKKCGFAEPKGAAKVAAIGYDELDDSLDLRVTPDLTGISAMVAFSFLVFALLGVRRMRADSQKLNETLVQNEDVDMTME